MDALLAAVLKVGPFALARTLLHAERTGATGVFDVERTNVTTHLFVDRGQLIFAEGGAVSTTLGRTLVGRGAITPQQYQELIMIMARQPAHLPTQRFGELAIAQGFLTAHQLHEALSEQVRIKTAACLAWPEVHIVFREGARYLERVTPFPASIPDLVATALRALPTDVLDQVAWPEAAAHQHLTLAPNAGDLVAGLKPTAAELRLVRGLEHGTTLTKLRAEFDRGTEWRGFFGLLVAADIIVAGAGADDAGTEAARTGAAAHADAAAQERARSAVGNLKHGLDELRSLRHRELLKTGAVVPSAEKRTRIIAEQLFQKGRNDLRNRALANALVAFKGAVEEFPDALEYQLYVAWTEFQMLDDKKQVREQILRLEELAKSVLEQDPNTAIGHSVLGYVRMRRGDEVGARKCFQVAQRLDPSDIDAERYLLVLQRRAKSGDS